MIRSDRRDGPDTEDQDDGEMRGERDRYVARCRIGAADEHEERAGKRKTKPGSLGGSIRPRD